jgi:Ca2+:H+ antiporter
VGQEWLLSADCLDSVMVARTAGIGDALPVPHLIEPRPPGGLQRRMACAPINRIPLPFTILPALGIAVWLLIGKVGLEFLALVLAAALLGNVIAAVHHAEVVALRLGEPFGTLVLALAVTVIEVGLIISIMLSGEPNLTLLRDSVHAVVMLVLHGLAGLCILVGAFRERESEFHVEGAKAFLAVLIPMATLVMVVPNYLVSAPGPYYSPLQLAFVSAVCLGLYIAFLFIQTGWHRAYFLPIGEEGAVGHARPSGGVALASLGMLLVALLSVVLLAKSLGPALEAGVQAAGAPLAIVGVIIAAIVLLPETAAAIRAAARRQLQASINLALGSAIASIGLSVPVVALASFWIGQPLELGISAGASVLMALGFVVAIITYGTGRTNLLSGIVHLVLLATYIFTVFAP